MAGWRRSEEITRGYCFVLHLLRTPPLCAPLKFRRIYRVYELELRSYCDAATNLSVNTGGYIVVIEHYVPGGSSGEGHQTVALRIILLKCV